MIDVLCMSMPSMLPKGIDHCHLEFILPINSTAHNAFHLLHGAIYSNDRLCPIYLCFLVLLKVAVQLIEATMFLHCLQQFLPFIRIQNCDIVTKTKAIWNLRTDITLLKL